MNKALKEIVLDKLVEVKKIIQKAHYEEARFDFNFNHYQNTELVNKQFRQHYDELEELIKYVKGLEEI